jgi:hypothetical protein
VPPKTESVRLFSLSHRLRQCRAPSPAPDNSLTPPADSRAPLPNKSRRTPNISLVRRFHAPRIQIVVAQPESTMVRCPLLTGPRRRDLPDLPFGASRTLYDEQFLDSRLPVRPPLPKKKSQTTSSLYARNANGLDLPILGWQPMLSENGASRTGITPSSRSAERNWLGAEWSEGFQRSSALPNRPYRYV